MGSEVERVVRTLDSLFAHEMKNFENVSLWLGLRFVFSDEYVKIK